MPEAAPAVRTSLRRRQPGQRRSRTLRTGLALLALIVAAVGLIPIVWPQSPDRQLDPAVAGLAAPGSRFEVLHLTDRRTLAAVAVEVSGSEVVLHGQPRPTRVALADLDGEIGSQRFALGSDEFGRDVAAL